MAQQRWQRIKHGGNTTVVFVHGLTGHFRKTWGRFPELIVDDPALGHCDVLCWGYPSRLAANWWRLPVVGRRLPELSRIADAFAADLGNPEIAPATSDLVLVGHSMGGLVILLFLLSCVKTPEGQDRLRRVRQVMLYASPTEGAQVPKLLRLYNRQLNDLDRKSDVVQHVLDSWKPSFGAGGEWEELGPPVAAVIGLEDGVVTEASARAFWTDVVTARGNHVEVVKPPDATHTSFQALRDRVLRTTLPTLIRGLGKVKSANLRLVEEAREELYTVGSRSRDPEYLKAIEKVLAEQNKLRYTRVLLGPPRRQELKDHLLRVRKLRNPADRTHGYKTLDLALFDDPKKQVEFNLCGNERRCLVVLPSAAGEIGEYDTAVVFSDPEVVRGYSRLAQALADAGTRLDDLDQLERLPVLG
jgi:pimeloyl-ACP methyl ester carboxylesterase